MPIFNFGGIHLAVELLAGSYGNSMFNLLMNCQTVFHSRGTIFYSHQQSISVPISPYLHQHLFPIEKFLAILVCVQWYLIVVLIDVSQVTNETEHFFSFPVAF